MSTRRFRRLTRAALNVIGVDLARAARCPSAEIRRMLWIAALLIAVWAWQSFIYMSALHIALSPDAFRPQLLLLAAAFSGLLMMAELSLFVRPIWDAHADAYLASNMEESDA